jgi:hypothetical protein
MDHDIFQCHAIHIQYSAKASLRAHYSNILCLRRIIDSNPFGFPNHRPGYIYFFLDNIGQLIYIEIKCFL